MRYLLVFCSCLLFCGLSGQSPDSVYYPNIKTAKLYKVGSQVDYPIIRLNSADKLNLKFDDLDADVKNYYYTYQLCNQDWSPVLLSTFDYIRGFTQERINDYRFSSVALTKYTHYEVVVPRLMQCLPIQEIIC